MRRCSKCGETKPLDDFVRDRRRPAGRGSTCARCNAQRNGAYYLAHREQRITRNTAYQVVNRDRIRARNVFRRYGVTPDELEAMLVRQGRACAICRQSPIPSPVIDHDHRCCPGPRSCGKCVRGVLCSACNRGLGQFADNPTTVDNAAAYLRATEAAGVSEQ